MGVVRPTLKVKSTYHQREYMRCRFSLLGLSFADGYLKLLFLLVCYDRGGAISEIASDKVAFDSRDTAFVIYIEGRWYDSKNKHRDQREKENIVKWVHSVVNSLNLCEEIRSTAHPESMRDQVSKSGRTKAPGWYNFGVENGTRLAEIKKTCDRRNVFSLASRVSWCGGDSVSRLRRTESNDEPLEREARERFEDEALLNAANSFDDDLPDAMNAEDSEQISEATSGSLFESEGDIEEFESGEEFRSIIRSGSKEWQAFDAEEWERANEANR